MSAKQLMLLVSYINKDLSRIKSSTAERFPNTTFIMIKKKAPILQEKTNDHAANNKFIYTIIVTYSGVLHNFHPVESR